MLTLMRKNKLNELRIKSDFITDMRLFFSFLQKGYNYIIKLLIMLSIYK